MNTQFQNLDSHIKRKLLDYLRGFLTESRISRIEEVCNQRTRHCSLILENIYQVHNISAVMRSCDCFGIQDLHIIDHVHPFKTNKDVDLGSSKWLNIQTYPKKENLTHCLNTLKGKGYRIVATTPHLGDVDLPDFDVQQKFALAFGTELNGLSGELMDQADEFLKIPMVGFTESLNISVSAAISLYTLSRRIRSEVRGWELEPEERLDLELDWVISSVRSGPMLARHFVAGTL